jgi:alpha-galactosidase
MTRKADPRFLRLEELDISQMTCGWGMPLANKTVLEKPLTIRGQVFAHGVGTHADGEFVVDLKSAAVRFAAVVGVDDEAEEMGTSTFEVWVDGKKAATSGTLSRTDAPFHLSADLRGAKTLRLVVRDEVNETHWAHADWCDARIELVPGAADVPVCPLTIILPSPPPEVKRPLATAPSINYPRITGATPGKPFLFRIPASGQGPLSFSAENLSEGLSLDRATGIISGVLARAGTTQVRVSVKGAAGSASETITIVGGMGKLCLTPPMGWNSWNVWGLAVDHDKVKAAADAFIASGLAAHGFQYVNIDDGWEAGRSPDGGIIPNEKFPDMKGLSAYVHGLGLKFGIYSSPGPTTCGGFTGSYQHEQQDAFTYADWGVDYLKYDWCSYDTICPDRRIVAECRKPYEVITAALAACNRDIVHSLCQYGMGRVWEWGREVGGNLWRTTGDITDTWSSMRNIGFRQHPHFPYAGPSGWNDPDMLVLGQVGWGPRLHATHLTPHEQMTHMSLWCLLSAPLLIGCDLTRLDEWTLTLLTNDELIGIDQDVLGKQARRVAREFNTEVWAKELSDGTLAVGLFNLGPGLVTMKATWDDLGLRGTLPARDLWRHEDVGTYTGEFKAEVAAHGVVLVKLGRPVAR